MKISKKEYLKVYFEVEKWVESKSFMLPKSTLSKMVWLIDNYETYLQIQEKNILSLPINSVGTLNSPKFIFCEVIFWYRPNYKESCDELVDITFINPNQYVLGYSIKRFIKELKYC